MSCTHSLPDPGEIDAEVVALNSYGRFEQSIASPKIELKYDCSDCGESVTVQKYVDVREYDQTLGGEK